MHLPQMPVLKKLPDIKDMYPTIMDFRVNFKTPFKGKQNLKGYRIAIDWST